MKKRSIRPKPTISCVVVELEDSEPFGSHGVGIECKLRRFEFSKPADLEDNRILEKLRGSNCPCALAGPGQMNPLE